jgi:hypothetical protein
MGAGGLDLQLSPRAIEFFPYGTECGNQEKLNVWEKFTQAEENAKKEGLTPLLVYKRNQSDVMVTLTWTDFIALVRRAVGE